MPELKPLKEGWFFYNKLEAILHLVLFIPVYLALFSIPFFFDGISPGVHSYVNYFLVLLIYFPLVFYFNTFYLIPDYLQQKNWWKYCTLLIGLVLGLSVIESIIAFVVRAQFDEMGGGYTFLKDLWSKIGAGMAGLLFASVISFAYRFTVDWIINTRLIETLNAERAAMELAFLKSQVDPHFLFNTLNSLYAVALSEKSHKTADGIAMLGTLMRYNLHDSQADYIPIYKEVDYIEKYIELQQLRLNANNHVELHVDLPEAEAARYQMAPMLLMPIVENAFKYGVSPTEDTSITIRLQLQDEAFSMEVTNSFVSAKDDGVEGGVGLKNVRERLALLYPGKHSLETKQVASAYSAKLELILS